MMMRSAPAPDQTNRLLRVFDEAVALHGKGDLHGAELLYRQILTEQPRHFASLHLLGVIAAQRGDHSAALELIDAALRINANDADALNNRGIALKELKHPHEALASFERAIALYPGHADAFVNRGNVLLDLRRAEEALACFDRAIALNPGHAHAFNNRGNALTDLERLSEALSSY